VNGDAAALAASLGVHPVRAVEQIRAGGNNELFRIAGADATFALKCYPPPDRDPRDRLAREFAALQFLWRSGERAIPQPIALDRASSAALYSWIDGERVDRFDAEHVAAALAFLARVHAARRLPDARELRPAEEAALDGGALVAQVEARLARFANLAGEASLQAFLRERFAPVWERLVPAIARVPALAPERQTLSPSDFGRHNALRRPDGILAFLDFEYFGWDDPVKLVADTLWHPGSAFDDERRAQFRSGALALYGEDREFGARLSALEPAYGLRWALIILAEFLPERWERRRLAGDPGLWEMAKARQLENAADYVARAAARSAG